MPWTQIQDFLTRGGPAMWAIAALSILTVALILWKVWRLSLMGAWGGARAETAVSAWVAGDRAGAAQALTRARGLRARAVRAAIEARTRLPEDKAREETARAGRAILADSRTGLRALELIATIAPLIGLLGTVLGMIAAFQALQESGNRADPSALAGGIWQALLTTAAGMTVAIPASVALSWFEAVVERVQGDMEDAATRIFTAPDPAADVGHMTSPGPASTPGPSSPPGPTTDPGARADV